MIRKKIFEISGWTRYQ